MITRIIGFVLVLIGAGLVLIGAMDISRAFTHKAQHTVSMRVFCEMGENAPIVRLDTREQVEAYLYACHEDTNKGKP